MKPQSGVLFTTAGAMRLPCSFNTDIEKMTHYLTDYYGQLFGLTRLPFVNFDENAYLKFYDAEKIRIKGEYCTILFIGIYSIA